MQVTVVLKHMFAPADLVEEPTLKDDLEADILAECTKLGPVDKVGKPLCVRLSAPQSDPPACTW